MAKDLDPKILLLRDFLVLCSMVSGPTSASDLRDEYNYLSGEVMEESQIYRILKRLMKARFVRYASTSRHEVHPSELADATKRYTLTDEGKEYHKTIKKIVESADGSKRADAGESQDEGPDSVSDR